MILRSRAAVSLAAVLALAVSFLAFGAVTGRHPAQPAQGTGQGTAQDPAARSRPGPAADPLAAEISTLQTRLRRLPDDYAAWGQLGLDYVQQAKITVNPGFYPKAQGALDRSLKINSTDNFTAMAGQAALTAAEHKFAESKDWAQRGLAINAYNSTLYGSLVDADTQLGLYDQAAVAAQRMLDLKPGVAAFTRGEYVLELRGDLAGATAAMQRALQVATAPSDKAFAYYYLGELAFNAGDAGAALRYADAGLVADPTYSALREGRAKAEAALGRTDAAVADYLRVVQEVPQPTYLIEAGEYLQSLGRMLQAQAQYALFDTENALFTANGVTLDTDPTLFYADHGDPARALKYAEVGIAIRPFLEMHDAYAWALHVNGRDTEALAQEKQAMAQGTRNALFFFHAGIIEKALGQRDAARKDLQTALAINPNFNPLQQPVLRQALADLGAA